MVHSESHFIKKSSYQLHIKRFYKEGAKESVLLVHGSIEDGRIFYSKSGKGLATYLAENGLDVFVADLRGKGLSSPKISSESKFGQREAIMEDIPDFTSFIENLKGAKPDYFIGHSWGGVLLLAYLARFSEEKAKAMVFFATKRDIRVQNIHRWLNVDILWSTLGRYLVKKHGYLPATKYKFGSADESKPFYQEVQNWVRSKNWIDPHDGFNYAATLQEKDLPPTLHITGRNDTHLGHSKDVKRLKKEIGDQDNHTFKLVGKKYGYLHDYDHINLLTHPDARKDHFPEVLKWLQNRGK